jgi:hypothetical protein
MLTTGQRYLESVSGLITINVVIQVVVENPQKLIMHFTLINKVRSQVEKSLEFIFSHCATSTTMKHTAKVIGCDRIQTQF